jgi:TrmH family RNA methyltransferase
MALLRSRANPRVRRWAKLVRDTGLRRGEGRAIIEGPHLVEALLASELRPVSLMVSEAGLRNAEIEAMVRKSAVPPVVLSDGVFRWMVDAESPPGIAAEIALPGKALPATGDCVFLEGVQDAGNVGAIARSAAAFGAGALVVDQACADPWSAKALRAGMGGHFRLAIVQCRRLDEILEGLPLRLAATVAHGGVALEEATLEGRLGWLFGSEGQGLSPALLDRIALKITIPTAAGTESLNVAAAAAICLHEAYARRPRLSRPAGRS